MNPLRSIFACLLCAVSLSQAAGENRRAEVEGLLSAFRLAEAERVTTDWLAQAEKNPDSAEFADALESSATVRLAKGEAVAAIRPSVERALAIRTRGAGEHDASLAHSINLLGALAFRTTDYKGAAAEYRRALELQSAETPLMAETLAGLGQATGFGGDPRAGLEPAKRALAIREVQATTNPIAVAETLNLIGTLAYQANDLDQAEANFLKASRMVQTLYGPDHFLAAQIDGGLASLYKERGQFAQARVLHEHVVRVFESVLGPNHPRLVAQYNNLGLCLKELGDLKGARAALEHALQISETANGPEASTTAAVLGNLGIALKENGDLEAARQAYARGLKIQEKRLGPDHQLVGAILFSLGSLLADMGDTAGGRARMERALAITDKALGPGSVRGVQIMDQLGLLLAGQKNFTAAREMFERAWSESRRASGDDNPRTAAALASLAGFYSDTGDFAGARERYRQALQVQEKQLGPQHYYTLETVYAWARTEQAAGADAVALDLFERVSAEWRKQFGATYPELAESLGHAAECLHRLGRREEALNMALESAAIRRTNLEIATHASGEREALLYAAKQRTGLDLALRIAASGQLASRSVQEVWDAVIRERALVLDEMAERHAFLGADSHPEVLAAFGKVKAAREELARAVVRGAESNQQDYRVRLDQFRTRVDEDERELAARSDRFLKQIDEHRKGFAEMASALPAQSTLVAYSKYDGGYLAFVLRAGDAEAHCVRLGSAAAIDGAVARWRAEIDRERDSMGRAASQNEASYRVAGAALRRAVWDPVAKFAAGSKAAYLVGDGAIQLVNFLSLPVGAASYVVEAGPEIRVLSTEKDLAEPAGTGGSGLLAMGGPAFDARPPSPVGTRYRGSRANCDGFAKLDFTALPGSASEVQEIARIGRRYGLQTLTFSGGDATEAAFKAATPGKGMIHVATHGFFLDSRCAGATGSPESPLLRAGLAFAGANRRKSAANTEEDGILTAEEVASLDLGSAEWVVLSGCDTGAGEVQDGEGVLGLRRAFRIAGARTLVMSLWPVDDQATRRWMIDLYEAHLARKLGAASAVRSASQQQLRARRTAGKSTHPFYWAGFIAVGN